MRAGSTRYSTTLAEMLVAFDPMKHCAMPSGLKLLTKAIDVPARRTNEIVKGLRRISVGTALRLGTFFGTDAQSRINLQTHYDTENARELMPEMRMLV